MSSAKRMRRFSHRVFRVFAISLLAVSTIFTTYFLYIQKQRLETALVDRSRGLGGLLATGATVAVYSESELLVEETLQGVVERRDVLSAAVFTPERTIITAAGRSPALKQEAGRLLPRDVGIVQRLGVQSDCLTHQEPHRIDTFCPVLLKKRVLSEEALYFEGPPDNSDKEYIGFVRITLDRGPMRRELASLALRSLALLAFVLVAGSWAGLRFSRRVTEPLERLTEAVRAFGAGGDVAELPEMPDDEIGRLAAAFTAMTRDLDERGREKEQLAERLQRARKMEAVGALSQGIAHDFKNILSTLKGAVHIMRKGAPEDQMVLKYTGRMQVSLDRARDLVERLVSFSRTRQLPAQPLDVKSLIERLAPMLGEAVGEGVRLAIESPGGSVSVIGDAASLEQLLLNLAYNGRDAMPGGGTLTVRLDTVGDPAAPGAGVARIAVQDTGTGMDPDVRRRLFEPYFTTKGAGAGMGLGLSIVQGIVEQHHGRIEVESEPDAGTTFRVSLPLAGDESAVPP